MRRSSQQQIMKVLWWQLLNTPNQKENKPTLRWCSKDCPRMESDPETDDLQ